MQKFFRITTKVLFVVILAVSMMAITETTTLTTANAAVKSPSVKDKKITLYLGYHSYRIQINGLCSNAKITYETNNSEIVTVNSYGIITPVSEGNTQIDIRIKQNNKDYNFKTEVFVENPNISITQSTNYMNIGDIFEFKAKGNGIEDQIKWSVSNSEYAVISNNGRLTALKSGIVTIYAQAEGQKAEINVIIGSNRLGTFMKDISISQKYTIWVTITDPQQGEGIKAKTKNSKILRCSVGSRNGNRIPVTITPENLGNDKILIKSTKTEDMLSINVNVKKKAKRKVLSAKEIYKKCGSAAVEVSASSILYGNTSGSGFFIGKNRIVTNYDVIEGADKIQIITNKNKKYDIKRIVGYDENLDIAILEIDEENASLVISQSDIVTGEKVYALGSPLGLTGTMTSGIISNVSKIVENEDYIQTTAAISEESSGGPLINKYGEVIGINTMYLEDGQNLNFAINIRELQKINTNRPITIEKYAEAFNKQVNDEYQKRKIAEDPKVSQDPDACQNVPAISEVDGTICKTENGDCYRFHLDSDSYFIGILNLETAEDLSNTYFDLFSMDGTWICGCYEEKDKLYQDIEKSLTAGDYFVVVSVKEDYTGKDMPYKMILSY